MGFEVVRRIKRLWTDEEVRRKRHRFERSAEQRSVFRRRHLTFLWRRLRGAMR